LVRGLYTATTGMLTQEIRLDTVSNNLANVDTAGYKSDVTCMKSFPQVLIHRINDTYLKVTGVEGNMDLRPMVGLSTYGAVVDDIATNFEQGSLLSTGNSFDMALEGDGFFVVQTPFGERLTRDGQFTMNADRQLDNMQGYRVMGQNGPIVLDGSKFIVDEKGAVFGGVKGDAFVDRLQVVTVDDKKTLRKVGHNLYEIPVQHPTHIAATDFTVRQNTLERSNVNAVLSLRAMLDVMRTYEANSKMIKAQDDMVGKAVSEIARV
jgi:flagellar basal-body rod protein FlgF